MEERKEEELGWKKRKMVKEWRETGGGVRGKEQGRKDARERRWEEEKEGRG